MDETETTVEGANKVLLYGASGYLGSNLTRLWDELHFPYVVGKARIDDEATLLQELTLLLPRAVVCFAGLKGVPNVVRCDVRLIAVESYSKDWFETAENEEIGRKINVDAQVYLAQWCSQHGVHCTLLSTGFLYNYDDAHPRPSDPSSTALGFTELDPPNWTGLAYVRLRQEMEEALAPYLASVLLLRINLPISRHPHPGNFLQKLVAYPRIASIATSFTVLDEMLPIFTHLLQHRVVGCFNFTNPSTISHDSILHLYQAIVRPNHFWDVVQPDSKRPAASLDVTKLRTTLASLPPPSLPLNSVALHPVEESIARIFRAWQSAEAKDADLDDKDVPK